MPTTIPITQARAKLPTLIDLTAVKETYITVKGKIKAALVNAQEYDRLKETLAVMSDKKTMTNIEQSLKNIKKGDLYDWKNVKKELKLD